MLRSILSRFDLDPLRAVLEGDRVMWRADDDDAGAGGSGSGGSSQRDDDGSDDDDDSSADDGDDSGADDDDDSAGERRAHRQAAKYRTKLREAERKNADLEARLAKLEAGSGSGDSDNEETKKRLQALEQELADERGKREKAEGKLRKDARERVVTSVAKSLKANDPDIIVAMAESGRIDGIDPDDGEDLDRDDVKDALRALRRSKPHLFESSSTGGGDGRNGTTGTQPTRRSRVDEDIEKLPASQRGMARLSRAFTKK
jgi:hypothetical protein